jgi:hypothetical protein
VVVADLPFRHRNLMAEDLGKFCRDDLAVFDMGLFAP